METLGDRIRIQRKYKGVTQEQLANHINISVMSIRRYESMERTPTDEVIGRIAEALSVTIPYLKSGDLLGGAVISERDRSEMLDCEHIKSVDDLSSPSLRAFLSNIPDGFNQLRGRLMSKTHWMDTVKLSDESFEERIVNAFVELNPTGQQVAVERIEELAKIPDYQKEKEPPQPK